MSAFDTTPNTTFKLGTLTFSNGSIDIDSGADSVTFNAALHFDNVPEKDFVLSTQFSMVNTLNTDDPAASADQVSIGSWGYTFNVLEGATATVDVMAKLSTGLVPSSDGTENGAARAGDFPFEIAPGYAFSIVELANPSAGGSVTPIPEPDVWVLLCIGLVGIGLRTRFPPSA